MRAIEGGRGEKGKREGGTMDEEGGQGGRTGNKRVMKEQIKQRSLARSSKCIHKSPHLGTPVGDLQGHIYIQFTWFLPQSEFISNLNKYTLQPPLLGEF